MTHWSREYLSKNMISLLVYFQNMEYSVVEEVPATTRNEIIAQIGGQMGLFVGASLITVIEILKCVILVLRHRYLSKNRQKLSKWRKQEMLTESMIMIFIKDLKTIMSRIWTECNEETYVKWPICGRHSRLETFFAGCGTYADIFIALYYVYVQVWQASCWSTGHIVVMSPIFGSTMFSIFHWYIFYLFTDLCMNLLNSWHLC